MMTMTIEEALARIDALEAEVRRLRLIVERHWRLSGSSKSLENYFASEADHAENHIEWLERRQSERDQKRETTP